MYLRLGLKPKRPGLKHGQNPAWDLNPGGWDVNLAQTYGLPPVNTDLVSGPNETQVLNVSLQKEFSERQMDK